MMGKQTGKIQMIILEGIYMSYKQMNLFRGQESVRESLPVFREGSPASRIRLLDCVRRLVINVSCGRSIGVSLAKLSQDGLWLRMYGDFFQVRMDGSFEEYSGIFPTWGMMLDGVVTELPTSERFIPERGLRLWPTPLASDGIAWVKVSKTDMQESIYKYKKNGHSKRMIHYLMYQGYSINQSAEYYEMMMGFPKGWTELNVWETR